MNKTELIKQVAQEANLTQKDATASVQAVLDQITQALAKGDSVQLIGFGTFEVRERSARTGRNPQTGEEMFIPGGKTPAFKAGKSLKEAVK
ncbi:DNA-binding protein [Bacillus thuringiensis]|uniref:HU family DNA-binding protein n=4 Tax=Bacillus cereus group TaxID=86661 RepID=A0A9X6X4Z4_BACCE|nr:MULTISPECIES: HU family DNA-binding protein [Bacillus cereus group]ANN35876.1 DNA-binding protein [Bacillus thuringiensis serovar coreanensis]MED1304038.1 HU family DNA-binding protein [Bacillus pacificus]MBG9539701.1 DNA-binding protein [Bacillus thuringiensis]MBG9582283.1 DNA-binding protein [Bacillus thuringiensis]MBG9616797.1 DNA-binding protein [Bacillus cereus]